MKMSNGRELGRQGHEQTLLRDGNVLSLTKCLVYTFVKKLVQISTFCSI